MTTSTNDHIQLNQTSEQLWTKILGQLQLQMTQATFDTWVKDTFVVSQTDDSWVIGTKSVFAKDWLENRLFVTINRTVTNVMKQSIDLEFVVVTDHNGYDHSAAGDDEAEESSEAQPAPPGRMSTDIDLWQALLPRLREQIPRTYLDNSYLISQTEHKLVISTRRTATDLVVTAQEWLAQMQNPTTSQLIRQTVTEILGYPIEVEFTLEQPEVAPAAVRMGRVDYYTVYFTRRSKTERAVGYDQLSKVATYFWMPLLGPAFDLWQVLVADDVRPLKDIGPNYWTPPAKFSYSELAERLNRKHGRVINGDTLECEISRKRRQEGQPLMTPADCCLSRNYPYLRYKEHGRGGLICQHWSLGMLEILAEAGLSIVQLFQGERKPAIQVWRMFPPLTPTQYTHLSPALQSQFDIWLDEWCERLGLRDRNEWRSITEPTLLPLMPGYHSHELTHNFDDRPKKQEFTKNAVPNPNFVTCM